MLELMDSASVFAAYRDPLFFYFPVMGAISALAPLLLFMLPYTLIALRDPPSLACYKIQPNIPARKRQEQIDSIGPSLRSGAVNYTVSIFMLLVLWPLIRGLDRVHMQEIEEPFGFAVRAFCELLFCIAFEDFIFYWSHRTLHHPKLYAWIHKKHHTYTAPIAINGLYMTPLEQNIILIGIMAGPLLLGSHVYTVWAWMFFRNWETAEEHCGYDFPFNPTRLLPFYDGACYHDFHHAHFTFNYAAVFPVWDQIFGTVAPGYAEYLQSRWREASSRKTK